jgi:hypothetical protein
MGADRRSAPASRTGKPHQQAAPAFRPKNKKNAPCHLQGAF